MCAGRVCLVPAAKDLAVGAMRDFSATKGSNIPVIIMFVHNVLTTGTTPEDIIFFLGLFNKET